MGASRNECYATENSFKHLDEALKMIDCGDYIYKLIASILHLGNIKFEQYDGRTAVTEMTYQSLQNASSLLNVDTNELESTLLTRRIEMNKMKIEM